MKLNKISMVIAAMAFVGCSSDDFNLSSNKTVDESGMIQLDENFVIAGVGEEDAATRTHWEWDDPIAKTALVNKFLPVYKAGAAFTATLDKDADLAQQAVGLCWLGNGAVGTDVYTNYEFYHFGWLNKGAEKANVECNELKNGALYNEITMTTGTASKEAIPGTDWVAAGLPTKATVGGAGTVDNLNYNSGVYKTDNKAIFGGKYIVYYPYNKNFQDAGSIPAVAYTKFDPASTDFKKDAELGKATFRYSAPVEIKGGDQASDFGLYNLSALVQLRVACPVGDGAIGETIDQIVLYSPSQQLLKQANLAADKIAAGKKGAELYAEGSKVGTKTIVANFAPVTTTPPVTYPALVATTGTPTSAYITVLPTTVDDLVVLVHSASKKQWARVNMGSTVFEAGEAKRLDISVKKTDFTEDFIAVDEASLTTALTEARLVATATKPKTIEVIGDITLEATNVDGTIVDAVGNYNINDPADAFITIKGGDIIVPEDVNLKVKTNMASDVRVLGKSCCSAAAKGGRLDIQGGTVNNVTMEKTLNATVNDNNNPEVKYSAQATVAAGKTFEVKAGNVIVNAVVQHKGDINIAADAKLTVNVGGDLNFMGGSVVNNGTIEVKKNGKFDMTDADGNATATDGQRMTNNGTFIHNVDAGVGTAVQSMHQNGEYRCKVDQQHKLDDAFLQWTACSVIEMVNTVAENYNFKNACKHNNNFIDIEVNSVGATTTFTNPTPDNLKIQIGKLTVTAGGLNVDFVNSVTVGTVTTTGKRELEVNGDMTVKAATQFVDSKSITITENLDVIGATLTYAGNKVNEGGLAVTGNITVDGGYLNAGALNALDITCANFYLKNGAQADFGNRTDGDAKNLVVSGTISNPVAAPFNNYFNILPAAGGNVLAWVTCKTLIVGGTWNAARPRVE